MIEKYDDCRANLEKLRDFYNVQNRDRNEATTRLHLIDRLFFECLGWNKDIVRCEESLDKQYADYTFLAPRRILIVEAKREGDYFELPVGMTRLEYSIQSIARDNANLKAALVQVAHYCQLWGVSIGVVTNGHQLVAFVATRVDGIPPLEGKALVFPSLEFMSENFLQLWQNLSMEGLQEKHLWKRLLGDVSPEIPPKLSTTLLTYPGIKQRNIFQTDLQIVSELVLEDIARSRDLEPKFLAECYCQSGALSQYALISKSILAARYAALADADNPGPTLVAAVKKEGISSELLAESMSRRPILIIGDVGVGKTTFIRHLINVEGSDLFNDAITFYLDLGSQATLTQDLREFVLNDITMQLRNKYSIDTSERNFIRGVYNLDLKRFSRSLYSDLRESNPAAFLEKEIEFLEKLVGKTEEHLLHSLEHIVKGRKKQIVVFLDNADQRGEETQQEAFLIAQELADRWPVTIFITLRPETFHRSLKIGALSGYHPKAFTISPPRIDEVLIKRLSFALKLTSGEIPIHSLTSETTMQLANLEIVIRVFLDSINRSSDLVELIDNISGGNIRLALDLVRNFFGSGHVDTQKIVTIFRESGQYYIPLHEFLRAVLYGDSEYYDPTRSVIANIFDVAYSDPKEHFILPLLLKILSTSSGSGVDEGFVATSKVYERLQGFGFTPEQIDEAILRGYNYKLINTTARRMPRAGQPMPPSLRVTTVGVYHVERLCRSFPYIDAIIVDTPIFDLETRGSIKDVHHITDRLDRADIFINYLDKQWGILKSYDVVFQWSAVSKDLRENIENIRKRLQIS